MYGERLPSRIGLPAAASLAVNGLLGAILLSLGMGGDQQKARAPAMTVMSLAATKGTDRSREEAKTPDDGKVKRPSVRVARRTPEPPPSVRVIAVPLKAAHVAIPLAPPLTMPPHPAGAQPEKNAAATQPADSHAAPSSPTSTPPATARKGAPDAPAINAPSGTSRSYAARIRSWVYAHKVYPRRARMRREEGVVQVRFIIDRAGLLLEGVIVRGSGNGTLDEEALATLRRASPFPKAPRDVAGERIEFTVPIEFMLSA